MEIKKVILLFLIIFTTQLFPSNNIYFFELRSRINLKSNEKLIIIFQQLGSCTKCFYKEMQKVEHLKKKIHKYKLIALVLCDRDIELKIYRDQYDWQDFLFRDDGFARKKLSTSEKCNIVVFNYNGEKIIEQ